MAKNFQNNIGNKFGSGNMSAPPQNYSIRKALADINDFLHGGKNGGGHSFTRKTKGFGVNDAKLNTKQTTESMMTPSWVSVIQDKLSALFEFLRSKTENHYKTSERVLESIASKLEIMNKNFSKNSFVSTQNTQENLDLTTLNNFVKAFDPGLLQTLNTNIDLLNTKLTSYLDKTTPENNSEIKVSEEVQNFFKKYFDLLKSSNSELSQNVNQSIQALVDNTNAIKDYLDKGWGSLDFSNLENQYKLSFDKLNTIDDKLGSIIDSYKNPVNNNDILSNINSNVEKIANSLNNTSATTTQSTNNNEKTNEEFLKRIESYIQNNQTNSGKTNDISDSIKNDLKNFINTTSAGYTSNTQQTTDLQNSLNTLKSDLSNAFDSRTKEIIANLKQLQTNNTVTTQTTTLPGNNQLSTNEISKNQIVQVPAMTTKSVGGNIITINQPVGANTSPTISTLQPGNKIIQPENSINKIRK